MGGKAPGAAGLLPQPGHAALLVLVQPAIDGIGMARFVQPVPGNGVGRLAGRDLQQGRRPFPQVGARIVVPQVDQCGPLCAGEC